MKNKNIWLLPTPNPSRLYYSGNNKNLLFSKELVLFRTFERSPQNIYITNDEKPKDGDWCYRDSGIIFKMTKELLEYYISIKDTDTHKKHKIILTTDQYLIKDGVQAIDDELEAHRAYQKELQQHLKS